MMTRMFEPQLGKVIEVYIDDMVIKSKMVSEHVKDLEIIFNILREHKLRLNASKCSFGVRSGRFLGSSESKRSAETHWHDRSIKPVHITISRLMSTFLPLDK